jgi:16S rRNA (guanine966-N2)-methyltransferase
VREAIFDILGSMGGVEGLVVADLFAGSGAMGIEALSRGAESVTFVERDPKALNATRANLAGVGLDDEAERVTLVRAELPGWLASAPRFDLAFCDPPYDFNRWDDVLGMLQADVAVLESSSVVDVSGVAGGWVVARDRRYGGTLVTVARQMTHHASQSS